VSPRVVGCNKCVLGNGELPVVIQAGRRDVIQDVESDYETTWERDGF